MAVINSCLLCCCGPSAPVVLKAEANVRVGYWAFSPALHPIRAAAACRPGPVERVSGSVQTVTPAAAPSPLAENRRSIATTRCFTRSPHLWVTV